MPKDGGNPSLFSAPLWPEGRNDALSARVERASVHPVPRQIHVLPSLSLGGAERIVCDLASRWAKSKMEADVFVLHEAPSAHGFPEGGTVRLHRLAGASMQGRIDAIAASAVDGTTVFAHLVPQALIEGLSARGVSTVPVVHNASEGWKADPDSWRLPGIPFVAACGELVARQLQDAGCPKPVRVLRHVVEPAPRMSAARRAEIRRAFGAGEDTLLIGMVGRFAAQKRYVRAASILAEIARRGVDVRLAVVGAARGEEGVSARSALIEAARRLGVADRLALPGPVAGMDGLVGAFDVFLNTSSFEGVSIATMEAVAAGVPVVSADAGGQIEAVGPTDAVLAQDAMDSDFADAVLAASGRIRTLPEDRNPAYAAAALWPWIAACGPGASWRGGEDKVLFVTGNLDVGGAQRSLCNLAEELAKTGRRPVVAVCGKIGVPGFMSRALDAGARFLDASGPGGLAERFGRVAGLIAAEKPRAVCFWNLDAPTKIALAKILEGGPARVCDASPGPMLYSELDAQAEIAKALSSSPDAYVASLDLLGSKYHGGFPAAGRSTAKDQRVVPNGVVLPCAAADGSIPAGLADGDGPEPPAGFDPALAAVCVGRLSAAKHPHLLPAVARRLGELLPGATLTVVGGTHVGDRRADAVLGKLAGALEAERPKNLFFAGPDSRTTAFLPRFACFLMLSEDQGCPNASLEAMASGLPVVANDDGGTREQVLDGGTGRLLPTAPFEDLVERAAEALAGILGSPEKRAEMGRNARRAAAEGFSMEAMGSGWWAAFAGTETEGGLE